MAISVRLGSVAVLSVAILLAPLSIARAADQYFAGDGSAFSAAKWGTSAGGPFNSNFTDGNTANFATVNGTGTGASIVVSGIVATENFTLTSTGGTISNQSNSVVTIDVASSKTLDFANQGFTTSGTAGYIKNGAGVLALSGGTYGGGFTLNSGTVVMRGVNAMGGSATNTLALNGGTVASDRTLSMNSGKYGGGITIGGNVQFGDTTGPASSTANLSFANNMSLGSSTHTLTLGNSGTVTFSGVISSSAATGVTFAATFSGTGRFDITGTLNTYTGTTTISGGEVRISGDGSLGSTPGSLTANSIVLDGGRLATATASSFTLNSNRGIQVSASTSNSISVTTSGTLTYDGVIADVSGTTGTWSKQGAGTLSLGGISTYSGATTINQGTLILTGGSDRLPTGTAVNLGQSASVNVGTLDLNGQNQQIAGLNSISGNNASSSVNNTVTSSTAATLTLGGSGTYSFGDGSDANSGVITGSIALVKNGSGTQTLGDANTYNGGTTVNSGTLLVTGSLGSGVITVNGGKLGGDMNTDFGAVTVANGGTIAPGLGGSTTGLLRFNSGVTFQGGSTLEVQINGTSAGTEFDQLYLSGGNVSLGGSLSATIGISSPTGTEQIVIIQNTGSGTLTGTFTNYADGATVATANGFEWKIYYGASADLHGGLGGNDVVIVASPVPEPGSIIAICAVAVGTGAAVRRWRRRRNSGNSTAAA